MLIKVVVESTQKPYPAVVTSELPSQVVWRVGEGSCDAKGEA